MSKEYHIETKCIQSGWKPKKGEPRMMPIYQSTTFKYDTTEEMGRLFDLKDNGYFYTRCQNPTNDLVASKIADLEGHFHGPLRQPADRLAPARVPGKCSGVLQGGKRRSGFFGKYRKLLGDRIPAD